MRRLAGLRSVTLIHHSLTDCIPLKAQHTNTISSTAGHLTSTSLTWLHANSIMANATPLSNTSVIEREILRLCTKLVELLSLALFSLSLSPSHSLFETIACFFVLPRLPLCCQYPYLSLKIVTVWFCPQLICVFMPT